jgi:ribosomal protein S18 acetylase RimI-like enzyme
MRTTIDVRTATVDDEREVAAALSAAFADDPVMAWCYPHEARRRKLLPGFFTLFARAIGRYGTNQVTADGSGAALWVPPGGEVVDEAGAADFEWVIGALSPPDLDRISITMETFAAVHPHEPHWYLNFMGVVPDEQGRGIGSALMEAGVARCDRDRMPAYLDATSADNRRLYERFGFETVKEFAFPDGPTCYSMWRRPA